MLDLIVRNGTIIDGTGAARYPADVGIERDRIRQVGDLHDREAREVLDAAGKIVAPGFVDVHNHSDAWLLSQRNFLPKTLQGFTTEVLMADGISYAPIDPHTRHEWIYYLRPINGLRFEQYEGWESLADYMSILDGRTAQNAITHIPYANVRAMACGFGRRVADDSQMQEILAGVNQGMQEGAVGISTGLDYISQSNATTQELVEACAPLAPQQGIYVSHVRGKKGSLEGLQEAVEIGRRAGVPVHISHFKAASAELTDSLLTYVDRVATQEVDFSFDVYPYGAGCTLLGYFLPYEVWEDGPLSAMAKLKEPGIRHRVARALEDAALDRIRLAWLAGQDNRHYLGKSLSEYAGQIGRSASEAVCDLLIEESLAVLVVTHQASDDFAHPFLAHEKYMMGTDGVYFPEGVVHPRVYGSAARLLGPCVRDHHLFSLEDAVYKLSAHAAARFGLKGRGTVRTGNFADLVVFDPETIADRATYADPHQYAVGVEHVLVNGTCIIRDGREVEDLPAPLPGRSLTYQQ